MLVVVVVVVVVVAMVIVAWYAACTSIRGFYPMHIYIRSQDFVIFHIEYIGFECPDQIRMLSSGFYIGKLVIVDVVHH